MLISKDFFSVKAIAFALTIWVIFFRLLNWLEFRIKKVQSDCAITIYIITFEKACYWLQWVRTFSSSATDITNTTESFDMSTRIFFNNIILSDELSLSIIFGHIHTNNLLPYRFEISFSSLFFRQMVKELFKVTVYSLFIWLEEFLSVVLQLLNIFDISYSLITLIILLFTISAFKYSNTLWWLSWFAKSIAVVFEIVQNVHVYRT